MLDQLPDIQRRWVQGDLGHGLAAGVALAILAASVLAAGRMRADYTWWRVEGWGPDHPRPEPLVGFWFIATGVILVLGLGMTWATGTAGLSVPRMAIFAGVPLLVGLLSALLRAVLRNPGAWPWRWLPGGVRRLLVRALAWVPAHVRPPDGRVLTRDHLGPIWLVGDVMATLVIVVGGAGLVRSFTAAVVLDPGHVVAWLALATGWSPPSARGGGPSGSTAGWTAPPPRSAPAGAAGGPSRCARATAAAAGRWSGPRSSTR